MNAMLPVSILGGALGPGEVILILVVALMLFGSKNLPKIARTIGKALEEFRRAAREVSNEIMKSEPPSSAKPDHKSGKPETENDTGHGKAG